MVYFIQIKFFGIHLVPTLVVYACTLPAVYALVFGYRQSALGIVFCVCSILSATLQGAADIEMHKFRKNKTGWEAIVLPSTSPANAAWTLERLVSAWSIIKNTK